MLSEFEQSTSFLNHSWASIDKAREHLQQIGTRSALFLRGFEVSGATHTDQECPAVRRS